MVQRLLTLLGFRTNKRSKSDKPDIRYADPSHNPKNWTPNAINSKPVSNVSSIFSWRPFIASNTASSLKAAEQAFKEIERIKRITIGCLQEAGSTGLSTFDLNGCISEQLASSSLVKRLLRQQWIKDQLFEARKQLSQEGRIEYNKRQEVWYPKANPIRELTDKEKGYHAVLGLGDGWKNITNELEGIRWLHRSFSPDEFEHFSINILFTHCGVRVTITEKRPISGADGGFDGTGTYEIDGKTVNVAVQVKRLDLMSQVGEQHCRDFAGALMLAGWNHGFMITTGKFSDRAIQAIEVYKQRGYFIELIDQDRLSKIMLTKTTQPHGFGLHKNRLWTCIHS